MTSAVRVRWRSPLEASGSHSPDQNARWDEGALNKARAGRQRDTTRLRGIPSSDELLHQAQFDIERLSAEITRLNSTRARIDQERADLRASKRMLELECAELRNTVKRHQGELVEARKECTEAKDKHVTFKDSAHSKHRKLAKRSRILEEETMVQRTLISNQKAYIAEVERTNEKLKKKAQRARSRSLRESEWRGAAAASVETHRGLVALKQEALKHQSEAASLSAHVEDLERERRSLKVEELRSTVEDAQDEHRKSRGRWKGDADELRHTCECLHSERAALLAAERKGSSTIARLEGEVQTLRDERRVEKKRWKQREAHLSQRNAELLADVKTLREENGNLQRTLTERNTQYDQAERQLQEYSHRFLALRQKVTTNDLIQRARPMQMLCGGLSVSESSQDDLSEASSSPPRGRSTRVLSPSGLSSLMSSVLSPEPRPRATTRHKRAPSPEASALSPRAQEAERKRAAEAEGRRKRLKEIEDYVAGRVDSYLDRTGNSVTATDSPAPPSGTTRHTVPFAGATDDNALAGADSVSSFSSPPPPPPPPAPGTAAWPLQPAGTPGSETSLGLIAERSFARASGMESNGPRSDAGSADSSLDT